jgi:hypothetical protein
VGKSNERREGAHMGEGQGTRGARARAGQLGRARSCRRAKTHDTHNHRSESKSRNETKQNTRLSTTSDKKYASA